MLKRPTERMDKYFGGAVGVGVKSSSAQAPVVEPSSTTLSIMKFNSHSLSLSLSLSLSHRIEHKTYPLKFLLMYSHNKKF